MTSAHELSVLDFGSPARFFDGARFRPQLFSLSRLEIATARAVLLAVDAQENSPSLALEKSGNSFNSPPAVGCFLCPERAVAQSPGFEFLRSSAGASGAANVFWMSQVSLLPRRF
jgi:hypothetical protein